MRDVVFSEDVAEATAAVGPALRRDPAVNNVALMLLARQADRPDPVARFWWSGQGDDIDGLCFQVGSERALHVHLGHDDRSLAARFATEVANRVHEVPGVDGPVGEASAFAAAWATERRIPVRTGMFQRFYALDDLTDGRRAWTAERVRRATAEDFDTVMPWAIAFQREAIEPATITRRAADATPTVDVEGLAEVMRWKLDNGEIWLLDDNGPQCMAGASNLVDGVSRIHLVYTPPERRGNGLAERCTGATVAAALERGATHCVLFTDLANPTSNAIYQRLGFEPVCEYLHVEFG